MSHNAYWLASAGPSSYTKVCNVDEHHIHCGALMHDTTHGVEIVGVV